MDYGTQTPNLVVCGTQIPNLKLGLAPDLLVSKLGHPGRTQSCTPASPIPYLLPSGAQRARVTVGAPTTLRTLRAIFTSGSRRSNLPLQVGEKR